MEITTKNFDEIGIDTKYMYNGIYANLGLKYNKEFEAIGKFGIQKNFKNLKFDIGLEYHKKTRLLFKVSYN